MRISMQTAQNFITDIGTYLERKLVIADDQGVILASSEPFSAGTKHPAICSLLEKGVSELREMNGIAIALKDEETVIGGIYIAGNYTVIAKEIKLIQGVAATLINSRKQVEAINLDERIVSRFIHRWLYGDNKNIDNAMIEYGASIGVDITYPRRFFAFIAVANSSNETPEQQQVSIDNAQRQAAELVRNERGGIAIINGSVVMCGVLDRDNDAIIQFVNSIRSKVEADNNVILAAGIDTRMTGYVHAHDECLKAEKAVRISARSPKKDTRLYDNINMEIFSGELSGHVKREYIRHIFKDCPPDEIRDWVYLLNAYYQNEGSIAEASAALGMPKNTLQYKLRKLRDKTGYDPRSIRFSGLFYNAIHFYSDLDERK